MTHTGTFAYTSPSHTPARGVPQSASVRRIVTSPAEPRPTAGGPRRTVGRSRGKRVARGVVAILAVIYLAVVGFITLTPAGHGDAVSQLSGRAFSFIGSLPLPAGFTSADAEFALNVLMFAPLGVFAVLLFGARGFWLAALAGLALSVGIEWVQEFVPSRVSDPRDLLANGTGAIVGALLALPFAPLFHTRRH
jgi:glycopeptide antibiotics resistance protein